MGGSIDDVALWTIISRFKQSNPVKAEATGERNLDMSSYMRQHGRPSKRGCKLVHLEFGGMVVTDIDFVMYDYQRKVMQLVETKAHGAKVQYAQSELFKVLDGVITVGAPLVGLRYLGLHILRLQNTTPLNSEWIEWDGQRVSKRECWRKLNMIDAITIGAA